MRTREEWLESGVRELEKLFKRADFDVPMKVKVSCSWPHVQGTAAQRRRVGECWSPQASAAGNHEIMISHMVDDPVEVLAILAHEMVHAVVGVAAGHGAPFRRCAMAIGLVGRMPATTAGERLRCELQRIVDELGAYPHAKLDPALYPRRKQSTRLLKAQCAACGYTARVARMWLDALGAPICPCSGAPMDV